MIRLDEASLQKIACTIKEQYGINLDQKKVLIECRLAKVLQKHGAKTFEEYLQLLQKDTKGLLAEEMIDVLTTHYTYFLREQQHFLILQEIMESLLSSCKGGIQIWSAGCSTGEEVYTLAMTLEDYKLQHPELNVQYQIYATDISDSVLDAARIGRYDQKASQQLTPIWIDRYFEAEKDGCIRVRPFLRQKIIFEKHNLMNPYRNGKRFDLILCRNVMIYFDKQARMKLVQYLENALRPKGYLMVGHAELLTPRETQLIQMYPSVYRKENE